MEIVFSALEQGLVPAILVIIYLLIVKVIDSKKESKQIKLNNQLIESISRIGNFVEDLSKNIIDKDRDKCKAAIEDSIMSSGIRLINFVSDTILHNHIKENKENIENNICNVINSEYYTIYSTLSMYHINNIKVSDVMKTEWMLELEKDIRCIIFDNKLDVADKVNAFTHKINFRFQSYITYIINKTLK